MIAALLERVAAKLDELQRNLEARRWQFKRAIRRELLERLGVDDPLLPSSSTIVASAALESAAVYLEERASHLDKDPQALTTAPFHLRRAAEALRECANVERTDTAAE